MAPRRRAGSVDVHGILLLDKPAGLSSNAALQRVRRHLNASKAGHTGSLDPAATGLLPLCFGDATKVTAFLLGADKTYTVVARLGVRTASGDLDSEAVERAPVPDWDLTRWQTLLAGFIGPQEQVPPMYSALKHQGQRLYKIARRGEEVERPARPIVIHSITDIRIQGEELGFTVRSSKGTYIRSLVEDIAARAGSLATTAGLRRVGLGPFDGAAMRTLENVEAASQSAVVAGLLPIDAALPEWPAVTLAAAEAERFRQGQALALGAGAGVSGRVRVRRTGAGLIGLGEVADDAVLRPSRVFADPENTR